MPCDICTTTAETKRLAIPFKDSDHVNVCGHCAASIGRIITHMRMCSLRAAKTHSCVGPAVNRVKIAKMQFAKERMLREGD